MKLEVRLESKIVTAHPQAVQGLGLLCAIDGRPGPTLILEYQALDKDLFWQRWKALGGERQGLVWDDGTPYKSPAAE